MCANRTATSNFFHETNLSRDLPDKMKSCCRQHSCLCVRIESVAPETYLVSTTRDRIIVRRPGVQVLQPCSLSQMRKRSTDLDAAVPFLQHFIIPTYGTGFHQLSTGPRSRCALSCSSPGNTRWGAFIFALKKYATVMRSFLWETCLIRCDFKNQHRTAPGFGTEAK